MPRVLLSTVAPQWPLKRQTPSNSGRWGAFNFAIDEPCSHADAWVVFESLDTARTVCCPPDRLVFVAGEPGTISNYHPEFLRQFSHVVISNQKIDHPQVWHRQQGQPWFIEKSFDELIMMQPIRKTKGACVIVSDKKFTLGHSKRLQFVDRLKACLGDRLDIWGRGIADFDSKWDLLKDYRYAVVLENTLEEDYLSEKLPDALLAFCFPFYAGCTNLDRYYPPGAYEQVDLDNPDGAVQKLLAVLDDEEFYERALPNILNSRHAYLNYEQFFPNLVSILQSIWSTSCQSSEKITLIPNKDFLSRVSKPSCGEILIASFHDLVRYFKNQSQKIIRRSV